MRKQKLYHFTNPNNLPSIRERGLVPALPVVYEHVKVPVVWLNTQPENAADWGSVMLTVTLDEFDPRLWFDPNSSRPVENWRIYNGTIPPDKIEFPA